MTLEELGYRQEHARLYLLYSKMHSEACRYPQYYSEQERQKYYDMMVFWFIAGSFGKVTAQKECL